MDLTNYKYEPPSIENLREKGLEIVEPQKENEPPPPSDLTETKKSEGDDLLNKILNYSKQVEALSETDVKITSLIKLNEQTILYKNMITAVCGSYGSHKSRFVETIMAHCLNTENNFIEIEINEPLQFLYIDTERDKRTLAVVQKKFNSYITNEQRKDVLISSFLPISRNQRFNALKKLIDFRLKNNSKHLVAIIDISTDLIKSFNNIDEVMDLFDYCGSLRNEFDVSFIFIIHLNPSPSGANTKSRGHLGSELSNKCAVELVIRKDVKTQLITLKFQKNSFDVETELTFEYCEGLLKGISKDDVFSQQEQKETELKIKLANFITNKRIIQKDVISFLRAESLGRNEAVNFLHKNIDCNLTNDKILKAEQGKNNSKIYFIEFFTD